MIGTEARGAWKELERHLRPYVARRVASAADIDDLLQDIFVRLHLGLATLEDEERFGGWVYRVANNAIIDHARQRSRAPRLDPHVEWGTDSTEVDADETLQSDLGECVALFVSRLPSPYRQAVTLTELEGLTQKDAADMLEVSLSALKSRAQRGRDKIRRMFEDCCRISVDSRGRVIECEPRHLDDEAGMGGRAATCTPISSTLPSAPPIGSARAATKSEGLLSPSRAAR